MDDDAESIITNQRYAYINGVVDKAVKKKPRTENLTVSDKIDQFVTNRILALPIFALSCADGTPSRWHLRCGRRHRHRHLCHRLDERCSVR